MRNTPMRLPILMVNHDGYRNLTGFTGGEYRQKRSEIPLQIDEEIL